MAYKAKMTKFERLFLEILNARIHVAATNIKQAKTLETKFILKGKLEALREVKEDYKIAISERING